MDNYKAFFDRDAVLNKAVIKNKNLIRQNLEELALIKKFEIITFLKIWVQIFVFTNQPDVARKNKKRSC